MAEATPKNLMYFQSDLECPFETWMNSLDDRRGRAKIDIRLDRAENGNFGECGPVGDGISEMKIDFGPGYRVYFAMRGDDVIILCGGNKKTQDRDIKSAKRYWTHYKEEAKE